MLSDQAKVSQWVDRLEEHLLDTLAGSTVYQLSMTEDKERHIFVPKVQAIAHGLATDYQFSHAFFDSKEYQAIVALSETLDGLIEEGAYLKRGEKQHPVASFEAVIEWMMGEAKRGYAIQRYKGLGEMNPEQLWETTMDPESRRMLKVTIEDAIAADQIFNTLMGDEVEPRRAFIETNALLVTNLDY
jgi:DNA gyrase subunit B